MRRVSIGLSWLSLIAATRGMLGAGLGLLLADKLTPQQRRAAGWTLFLAGAATTLPLAARVLGALRAEGAEEDEEYRPA